MGVVFQLVAQNLNSTSSESSPIAVAVVAAAEAAMMMCRKADGEGVVKLSWRLLEQSGFGV